MNKRTNGEQGEKNCQKMIMNEFGAYSVTPNKDAKYDFIAKFYNGEQKTFEVKTNPAAAKYGGYSVEVGHLQNTYITSYANREAFQHEGYNVVYTGLMESKADFYIFHDDKKQYYIIKKSVLLDWAIDVWENQHYRFRWGGDEKHTLQAQIKISELLKLGKHIDLRQKRGRKPKQNLATQG